MNILIMCDLCGKNFQMEDESTSMHLLNYETNNQSCKGEQNICKECSQSTGDESGNIDVVE